MRITLALATVLALPAAAQEVREGFAATYTCAGGTKLETAYLNAPDGTSYAVVAFEGRLVPMKSGPTGSGVRYLTLGDGEPLVWHTKGKQGFLARDDADVTMLVEDCTTDAEW